MKQEGNNSRLLEGVCKCESSLPRGERAVESQPVRQSKAMNNKYSQSASNRPTARDNNSSNSNSNKMKRRLDGRLAGLRRLLAASLGEQPTIRTATMISGLVSPQATPVSCRSRRRQGASPACGLGSRRAGRDAPSQPIICYYYSLLLAGLIVVGALLAEPARGAKLPDIYWNSSNPIFRIDNTDHIFDVNKKQHDHDQVDLVCPQQQPSPNQLAAGGQSLEPAANKTLLERYIIYSVSKEEYESCRVDGNENRRIIAVCDQPSGRVRPVTVTFRSYTPQPNGFEYKPGQDYYFITALYNQQLEAAKRFAPCREQNMKVIFKVCCKPGSSGALMNSLAASSASQQSAASSSSGASLASIIRQQSSSSSSSSSNGSSAPGPRKPNSQSARQTPFASTLRPVLVSSATSMQSAVVKQQQQLAALDDRLQNFVGLGGSPFSSSGQQPQPITVLPIEVQEPSSTEKEETILNDIPPPTPAPQPAAQPLPSIYQPRWPVYRAPFENRLHPTGADLIASRYPPTPLPPWIPIRPANVPEPTKVRSSQFGMRPEPAPWLVSASRISLYPNFPSLNNEPTLNSPGLPANGNQPDLLGPAGAGRPISSFGWTEAAALLTVMLAIALIVMATKMRHEQRLGQLR